jgi:uncharacterized protein involved in high-affinity Fe2+ transport
MPPLSKPHFSGKEKNLRSGKASIDNYTRNLTHPTAVKRQLMPITAQSQRHYTHNIRLESLKGQLYRNGIKGQTPVCKVKKAIQEKTINTL